MYLDEITLSLVLNRDRVLIDQVNKEENVKFTIILLPSGDLDTMPGDIRYKTFVE